jgi:hypothetical protein
MSGPIRILLAAAVLALAACGTDPTDRVQGGAATGAATGAGIGIIGGPVGIALGAVVGGGAGAIAGASTDAKQVDLGSPPWSDH